MTEKIKNTLRRFMAGRYGNDQLSVFIMIVGMIFVLLAFIPAVRFFVIIAFAALVWSTFRCYSRNISKRRKENEVFMRFITKIKSKFRMNTRILKDRKTHCCFRCKKCNTMLRVPKGKGKIEVTCPKCHEKIQKTT